MAITEDPSRTDRRAVLVLARDKLLAELESGGHAAGCDCTCGPVADGRVLAAVTKELRATVAELDALPVPNEGSVSSDLRARIAQAWGPTG